MIGESNQLDMGKNNLDLYIIDLNLDIIYFIFLVNHIIREIITLIMGLIDMNEHLNEVFKGQGEPCGEWEDGKTLPDSLKIKPASSLNRSGS